MPLWFLVLLALCHLGGLVAFLLKPDYGFAIVMLGGMIVQIGLMIKALSLP
jgi:hypothetical protein